MSFKPEVTTDSSGKFYGNALTFATYDEALANAQDLSWRWTLVRDYRAVESTDPAIHTWVDGKLGYVSEVAV
jgi:hypothetical protein